MKQTNNLILQLQTFPACSVGLSNNSGLSQFRKELIKVGKYTKASTNQIFEVTLSVLQHWVETFKQWTSNGNKVSIPNTHEGAGNAKENQGWVTDMFVEDNSLYGLLELLNPALALVTDVSIGVPASFIDGGGHKYISPITHVALCTDPVIGGLKGFEHLSLSLNKGANQMELLKKLAEKLGLTLSGDALTEEAVMLAVDAKLKEKTEPLKIAASLSAKADPIVVKLLGENRLSKINALVSAALITPAVKEVIAKQYVEADAISLSLSTGGDDAHFALLMNVLTHNSPVSLKEQSGVQSLELANQSANKPNAVSADITKRRAAAGIKD